MDEANLLPIPWQSIRVPRTNLPDIFDGLAIMHEDEDFSDLIIDEMWAMSDTEEDGTRFVAPFSYAPAMVLKSDMLPPEVLGTPEGMVFRPKYIAAIHDWITSVWPGVECTDDEGFQRLNLELDVNAPFPETTGELLALARKTVLVDIHDDLTGVNGVERRAALWDQLRERISG